jgi:hypothetical protein
MRFFGRTATTVLLASAMLAFIPALSEAASRGGGMGGGRGSAMTAAPGGMGGGGPRMGGGHMGRPHIGVGPRVSGHMHRPGHRPGLRPPSGRPHFKPGHRPGHGHYHRPQRPRIVVPYYYGYYGGPLYDGYYDDSVVAYDDDCGWLYRKARQTGKAYWWRRYERCMGYD